MKREKRGEKYWLDRSRKDGERGIAIRKRGRRRERVGGSREGGQRVNKDMNEAINEVFILLLIKWTEKEEELI